MTFVAALVAVQRFRRKRVAAQMVAYAILPLCILFVRQWTLLDVPWLPPLRNVELISYDRVPQIRVNIKEFLQISRIRLPEIYRYCV